MPAARLAAAARGLAVFFGALCVVNVIGLLRWPAVDSSVWWVDLRFLRPLPRAALLSVAAGSLIAWSIRPDRCRTIVLALLTVLLAIACRDVVRFYALLAAGSITTSVPVPVSAFVVLALCVIVGIATRIRRPPTHNRLIIVATVIGCLTLAPMLQMVSFGRTDYRRRADAIIVPGARAHADGRPSQALRDRVETACRLYQQGYAPTLIFSGGPGDGSIHEVEVMRTLAIARGIPASAMLLDPQGLNTSATARNAAVLLRARGMHRALLVTHFYHTARAKIAFQRHGLDVFTVPAQSDKVLVKLPQFMAREAAALWVYYLAPAVKWNA